MQKNKDQKSTSLTAPIILIGIMECGKSHIGKILAQKYNKQYYDSDSVIEKNQALSIATIFEQHGEEYFREAEFQAISDILKPDDVVLSVGGGAVTLPKTLALMKEKGVLIWRKSDIDVVCTRLKDDNTRPLLQTEDPRATLENLFQNREHLYSQAPIHIENNDDSDGVITNITQALKNNV